MVVLNDKKEHKTAYHKIRQTKTECCKSTHSGELLYLANLANCIFCWIIFVAANFSSANMFIGTM